MVSVLGECFTEVPGKYLFNDTLRAFVTMRISVLDIRKMPSSYENG